LEPYRVVVVDDDLDIAGYIKLLLERRLGCIVTMVVDPTAVHAAVVATMPDLVITDIQMPGISGLDLIADIHEIQPGTPVVVMTGYASVDYAVKALRYKASEFLTKPVTSGDLMELVPRLADEFRALKLSARQRQVVLAIGAGPDDVGVGVGGILAAHRAAGDDVTVLTLSKGNRPGTVQQAFEEASAGAAVIGARLIFEENADTSGQARSVIQRVVGEVTPTIVYVHSKNDRLIEHRIVHEATLASTEAVNTVACYAGTTGTLGFSPVRFVPIDDVAKQKLAMLACYATRGSRPPYLDPDFVTGSARYWSQFGSGSFCEPLEIIRESSQSLVMPAASSTNSRGGTDVAAPGTGAARIPF
jgi:CheY-like chemotaxis protein